MNEVKPSAWFDPEKEKETFGFKVKHKGHWYNAADGSKPLFFDTKEERNAAMNDFKNRS